jgi:hypothetical protein
MADIDTLIERLEPRPGVTFLAVDLNEKGRERRGAGVLGSPYAAGTVGAAGAGHGSRPGPRPGRTARR